MAEAADWKMRLGTGINYSQLHSSDEDDIVIRNSSSLPRGRAYQNVRAEQLLEDSYGFGSDADMLSTTPPRSRIREKERKRQSMGERDTCLARLLRNSRRNTVESFNMNDLAQNDANGDEKRIKRRSKLLRCRARDSKVEFGTRADSMPTSTGITVPSIIPATLIETCNRFMSLSSRPVCHNPDSRAQSLYVTPADYDAGAAGEDDTVPANRIQFHKMFSMLIKMGSGDKTCRRTISMEEQVWQNELKDLIWLEVRAKLAGQSPSQHDAVLCAQRKIVPTIIQNIINYRFINDNPCCKNLNEEMVNNFVGSIDELSSPLPTECLSISCDRCSDVLGKALKEVGTLLESFSNAESLYPSSKAMATHHPLIATQLFSDRLKALCLWYNISRNLRLTILMMRKLLTFLQIKVELRQRRYGSDTHLDADKISKCASRLESGVNGKKKCTVKFEIDSAHPSDSNSSSVYSENSESVENVDAERLQRVPSIVVDEMSDDSKPDSSYMSYTTDASDSDVSRSTVHNGSDKNQESRDTSNVNNTKVGYSSLFENADVNNIGSLKDVTNLRIYGNCETSPYRIYIESVLKTKGLRTSLKFVDKLYQNCLKRAHVTLTKFDVAEVVKLMENGAKIYDQNSSINETDKNNLEDHQEINDYDRDNLEMKRYGCWSPEGLDMKLPSYRGPFILLATIPLELIHEYMLFRLESKPEKPSALSIKQLIHEMKDGLDIAADSRAQYVCLVDAALESADPTGDYRRYILGVVRQFDSTVEKVFQQYIQYLSIWSEMEHLPRSVLDMEWSFSFALTKKTRCGTVLVPVTFCSIIANQLNNVAERLQQRFAALDSEISQADMNDNAKQFILGTARAAQAIFAEERNVTLCSAQFAKMLSSNLTPSVRYSPQMVKHMHRLYKAMFRVGCTITSQVAKAEDISKQARELSADQLAEDPHLIVRRVLLHGYRFGFDFLRDLHFLMNENAAPKQLHRAKSPSVLPDGMQKRRPLLRRADSVGSATQDSVDAVADSITLTSRLSSNLQTREEPPNFGLMNGTKGSKENLLFDPIMRSAVINDTIYVRDIDAKECCLDTDDFPKTNTEFRAVAAKKLINFAKMWMKFVTDFCDRGRGLRPRWASNGLEFLMLVCDPQNTKYLSNEEFEELKNMIDGCISHVVGSSKSPGSGVGNSSPIIPHRPAPPPPTRGQTKSPARPFKTQLRHPQHTIRVNTSPVPEPPTPPTPPVVMEPIVEFPPPQGLDEHNSRVSSAIAKLETAREEALRSRGSLGRPLSNSSDSASGGTTPEPKLRQLTFKWQRGIKIGAGRFGKVYTVVNTESGQLLAMKEVSLGPGDWKAVQKAANELRVLEGVVHPHLVRHYGCEIYREEMLIFMELCVEGSLDNLLAHVGAPGLPEQQVRRYTRQLLLAVAELHKRQIAHRDIKAANIFLTHEGHCLKLGDFGCAVKIRANTTVPGELQGYVGTQAYMAPEVFMKSTGHGRLADIWSVGCVVTEMASGKRPFSEYDSNYQIMFLVGMGGRPEIPSQLSQEGQDFCLACLTHELSERPHAFELLAHDFILIGEDDCACEEKAPPLFNSSKKINLID